MYKPLHPYGHRWQKESADRDGRSRSGGRRGKSGAAGLASTFLRSPWPFHFAFISAFSSFTELLLAQDERHLLIILDMCVSLWSHHHSHSNEHISTPNLLVPFCPLPPDRQLSPAGYHCKEFPLSRILYRWNSAIYTHFVQLLLPRKTWDSCGGIELSSSFSLLSSSLYAWTTNCFPFNCWWTSELHAVFTHYT